MNGPFTVVSFHAHPDDEALLTGGTLARAAAEGHRVVLVVATSGEAGLARAPVAEPGTEFSLGEYRRRELAASARALGVARVEVLGYADSGSTPEPSRPCFATTDVESAAQDLAAILRSEDAQVLTTYDQAGGYGHPDHVQVHRVGQRAAQLAQTPLVLEATIDRSLIAPIGRFLALAARIIPLPEIPDLQRAYTARKFLTHRIDVGDQLGAKRAALRAHASQAGADRGVRTLALLLALPRPLAQLVLGREWFREVGRSPGHELVTDIFASLR